MSEAVKGGNKSLAGLRLDAVLGKGNITPPPPPPPPPVDGRRKTRTLLDIIREEDKEGNRDKKSWKTFRDKLRLKRTGSAWISSVPIPTSDIYIPAKNNHGKSNHRFGRHGSSLRSDSAASTNPDSTNHHLPYPMSNPNAQPGRPLFSRDASMRMGSNQQPDRTGQEISADVSMPGEDPPSGSFRLPIGRQDSVRQQQQLTTLGERDADADEMQEERSLSAREAVVAQEASEAEAVAAAENEVEETPAPVTMSLMDLLEETDRQMGLTSSKYTMDIDEEEYDDEDYDDEEDDVGEEDDFDSGGEGGGGGGEFACCICMVKISGASSIPCGHTFCRLCSRELMVQKGHCPVCCKYVLEFLEIF